MNFTKLTEAWKEITESGEKYEIAMESKLGTFYVTPVQITKDNRIVCEVNLDKIPEPAQTDDNFRKALMVAEGHSDRVRLVVLVDEQGNQQFTIWSYTDQED